MERVIEILPTEEQVKRVVLDFEAATWKSGFTWCEAEGMRLPLESGCFPQGKCLLLSLYYYHYNGYYC